MARHQHLLNDEQLTIITSHEPQFNAMAEHLFLSRELYIQLSELIQRTVKARTSGPFKVESTGEIIYGPKCHNPPTVEETSDLLDDLDALLPEKDKQTLAEIRAKLKLDAPPLPPQAGALGKG
jgi:hypothetical protein